MYRTLKYLNIPLHGSPKIPVIAGTMHFLRPLHIFRTRGMPSFDEHLNFSIATRLAKRDLLKHVFIFAFALPNKA